MRPTPAFIELGNEFQQAGFGCVDVGGEFGDLLAESLEWELHGSILAPAGDAPIILFLYIVVK